MTALPATVSPVSAVAVFDDDVWEDLLNYIEEKRVIPIVGPELCVVQTEAGTENLYTWLARSLAARLNHPAFAEPSSFAQPTADTTAGRPAEIRPPTLNDVVVRHLSGRGRREDLYARIRTIMREATFAPPPALVKLAEIADFDLYLTTASRTGSGCCALQRRGSRSRSDQPWKFEVYPKLG